MKPKLTITIPEDLWHETGNSDSRWTRLVCSVQLQGPMLGGPRFNFVAFAVKPGTLNMKLVDESNQFEFDRWLDAIISEDADSREHIYMVEAMTIRGHGYVIFAGPDFEKED